MMKRMNPSGATSQSQNLNIFHIPCAQLKRARMSYYVCAARSHQWPSTGKDSLPLIPEVRDEGTMPTAQIISSKGQSMMGLYSELRTRKAYGTALLANNNNIAEAIRNSADLHDEDEIKRLLDEANEEVRQEIDTDRELTHRVKNGALT
jgi:hypothetical protein